MQLMLEISWYDRISNVHHKVNKCPLQSPFHLLPTSHPTVEEFHTQEFVTTSSNAELHYQDIMHGCQGLVHNVGMIKSEDGKIQIWSFCTFNICVEEF